MSKIMKFLSYLTYFSKNCIRKTQQEHFEFRYTILEQSDTECSSDTDGTDICPNPIWL